MQEFPITVRKVWGKEVWLVNEPEYCAKYLHIDKDAQSSLHYHTIKKETFICLSGVLKLELGNEVNFMKPDSPPLTICKGQIHRMKGITDAVILEISTHHEDNDVVRIEESKK